MFNKGEITTLITFWANTQSDTRLFISYLLNKQIENTIIALHQLADTLDKKPARVSKTAPEK